MLLLKEALSLFLPCLSVCQGVMESFLGTALAGTVFCLFGGQPLIILSSTGPILIFEKLLYEFSKYDMWHPHTCLQPQGEEIFQFNTLHFNRSSKIDYMELRLWIGLHSCLQCFVLVLTDASYIIKYMTRFTEEGFSSLISFIFISDAIKKMVSDENRWRVGICGWQLLTQINSCCPICRLDGNIWIVKSFM